MLHPLHRFPILKVVYLISLILISILLGGCASGELSIEQHSKQYAPALGVEESDIQFLSYCNYSVFWEPKNERAIGEKGILALTDSKLCLVLRNKKSLISKDLISIPIGEIEGISYLNSQVQLRYRGQLMVLEVMDPFGRRPRPDQQKHLTIFNTLAATGIPVFEGTRTNEIRRYRQRWSTSYSDSGIPRYIDTDNRSNPVGLPD